MEIFWTVVSGVTVYILGQFILKWIIEPVQYTRRTIAQIAHALKEHQSIIANPGVPPKEEMEDVSRQLRKLSAQLFSSSFLIPKYGTTRIIFGLPQTEKLRAAETQLRALSHGVFPDRGNIHEENAKRRAKIFDLLNVPFPADERWPDD